MIRHENLMLFLLKMIELITIIKHSEELTSSSSSFDQQMSEELEKFFQPASRIVPSQFHDREDNDRRQRRGRTLMSHCYTHTVSLIGKCYVMCNKKILIECATL